MPYWRYRPFVVQYFDVCDADVPSIHTLRQRICLFSSHVRLAVLDVSFLYTDPSVYRH